MAIAVPARVFDAYVMQYRDLGFDVQLLANFLAHAVQRALTHRLHQRDVPSLLCYC